MKHLPVATLVCLAFLGACQGSERAATVPPEELAVTRLTQWDAVRGERDVCPATEIHLAPDGPQSRDFACAVVARAWSAISANGTAVAFVNRDSTGLPKKAKMYFFRSPDLSKPQQTNGRILTYWQVNFPSKSDSSGVSVVVDSTSGETHVFADHVFGQPFRDALAAVKR